MKRFTIFSTVAMLLIAGCQQPYDNFSDCVVQKQKGFGVKRYVREECDRLFPKKQPLTQSKSTSTKG